MKRIIFFLFTKLVPERFHKMLLNYYTNERYSGKYFSNQNYIDDFQRLKKYGVVSNSKSKENLLTLIISYYHSIEKGFSMPDFRNGFGQEIIVNLIRTINKYKEKYNDNNPQFIEGIKIVKGYIHYHDKVNFIFDNDIRDTLTKFDAEYKDFSLSTVLSLRAHTYFKNSCDFFEFSNSRHSLRNYNEKEVPIEMINKALKLSENTPTGCNRQPIKVFVLSDKILIKKVLEIQNGNRGFGHKADKIIMVCSTYSKSVSYNERNQIIVDGGIYLMNLLYSLHYYKIGACPLNCNLPVDKANKLRYLLNAEEDIFFVSMISIGFPPEVFCVPKSLRDSYRSYTTYL